MPGIKPFKKSLFHDAVSCNGNLAIVVLFSLFTQPSYGLELFDAIKDGDKDKVIRCIDEDSGCLFSLDENGASPLIMATDYENTEIAEILLMYGADFNAIDKTGRSALSAALQANNPDLIDLYFRQVVHYFDLHDGGSNQPDINHDDVRILIRLLLLSGYPFTAKDLEDIETILGYNVYDFLENTLREMEDHFNFETFIHAVIPLHTGDEDQIRAPLPREVIDRNRINRISIGNNFPYVRWNPEWHFLNLERVVNLLPDERRLSMLATSEVIQRNLRERKLCSRILNMDQLVTLRMLTNLLIKINPNNDDFSFDFFPDRRDENSSISFGGRATFAPMFRLSYTFDSETFSSSSSSSSERSKDF